MLRCGERRYWEQWAESVADIARTHRERIGALIETPGPAKKRFGIFVRALRRNLNDSISENDAAGMLSQHLITKPVFDALFGSSRFAELNPVSQAMQRMIEVLKDRGLEAETKELADFYASVRRRAEGIDNAAGRQRIAIELYDNFFRKAFPKEAERLGIVFTPVEIVDFIIRAVSDLLQREFGASLSDEGVHVLDPFTGTGTFVAQLLQSGLIAPDDLRRKYRSEIHANEIMLLAYYIAAVNIETAYDEALRKAGLEKEYEPFGGIVLTDTFQASEPGDRRDQAMFPRNDERMERQLALDIRVILSNPPWSRMQRAQSDRNQNQTYPSLDASLESSYAAESQARFKGPLYDSYVRAIRWASNRVLDSHSGGVVGFVTNGGFLTATSFDGFRRTVEREFHEVWVYNLRGNTRGDDRKALEREGGKVFGQGSRATVAVLMLVKRAGPVTSPAVIKYCNIGDYLSTDEKLEIVEDSLVGEMQWDVIHPNEAGDWLDLRSERFAALRPLAEVKGQPKGDGPIFGLLTLGLISARDAWVFASSKRALTEQVEESVAFFNDHVTEFRAPEGSALQRQQAAQDFAVRDDSRFRWDDVAEKRLSRGLEIAIAQSGYRTASYRPFLRQRLYMDSALNSRVYQLPQVFPPGVDRVPGIWLRPTAIDGALSVLATDTIPAGLPSGGSRFLPRYLLGEDAPAAQRSMLPRGASVRRDNITDEALTAYRTRYGNDVTTDHIFAYVYGILHSPNYRERYATDLARMLPRIPEVSTAEAFYAFSEAGQDLLDLHIGYEEVEPYPLDEQIAIGAPDAPERYRVEKMKWAGNRKQPDRSRIVYNDWLTLAGIPDEAHNYVVGPRSALEWLIDRYRVKTDKPSGIVNDVNDWGLELDPPNPRYIVDLIKRITTVSVETMKIVDSLPPLREAD